jgi:TonB dependent receptor
VRFSYKEIPYPRGSYSYTGIYTSQPGTSFTGSGVADFLVDYQNSAGLSQISNVDHLHWAEGAYVQDDWIVNPRLTLNLGLRYDYYQPYLEIRDRQANFVPQSMGLGVGSGVFLIPEKYQSLALATSFLSIAQQNNFAIQYTSNRSLSTASKTNFSPRVGISFRGSDKLVFRTGFGLFYGGLESIGGTLGQQYPFESTSSYLAPSCVLGKPCATNGITLPVGFADLAGPGPQSPVSFPNVAGRPLHYRDGYSEQWNLMTQYAINPNLGLTVGYVGGAGRHMQTFPNLDSPAALAFPGTNMQPYTAFPLLGGLYFDEYEGKSSYNALQSSLEKRFSSGMNFLATYTWGHSLDTGSSQLGSVTFRNPVLIPLNNEIANSTADARQRVTFNGSYQLPIGMGRTYLNQSKAIDTVVGGWSIALTFAAQTGNPISISPNIVTAAGGTAFAFRVGDPFKGGGQANASNPAISCPAKVRTLINWFNPCAFANPLPGASVNGLVTNLSDAISYLGPPRYQTYGPGFNNTNMSIFKNFTTYREQYLQFRADLFNIFNTPAYGNPSDTSINSNSGYILNARSLGAYTPDARFIQLALKYYF